MDIWSDIQGTRVARGAALFWLGQAGFLIRDAGGRSFAIDPYLSDCGFRIQGSDPAFKRMSASIVSPREFEADLYLATHQHFDHFDFDAVPRVAENPRVTFAGPPCCEALFARAGVPAERLLILRAWQTVVHAGITLTATAADHGDMVPDAVGALVEMGGVRVWFSGDTAYRPDIFQKVAELAPDVAVVSINGEFGNMNAEEGAAAALAVGARLAVPCHFWTFTRHGGRPGDFGPALAASGGDCRAVYLRHGEGLFFEPRAN